MGTLDGPRHETPVHVVEIQSFFMDRAEVTVGDFGKFVEATQELGNYWVQLNEAPPAVAS